MNSQRAVAQRPAQAIQPSAFSRSTLATVLERCGYTSEQQDTLRALVNPPGKKPEEILSDAEIQIGVEVLAARGLDILKKHGYLAKMSGQLTIIPSIDGLRAIAARTGEYAGTDAAEFSADGKEWTQVWLESEPPAAAKVRVYRIIKGQRVPFEQVVLYRRFKGFGPGWSKYPENQLAVVAERHALRKGFPEQMTGLDVEEPPEEVVEDSARAYFWMEMGKAGWEHDAVHELMFGISAKASLDAELAKRGMDWRDAAILAQRVIASHAPPAQLPPAKSEDVNLLYEPDPAETARAARTPMPQSTVIDSLNRQVDTETGEISEPPAPTEEMARCTYPGCTEPMTRYGPSEEPLCDVHAELDVAGEPEAETAIPFDAPTLDVPTIPDGIRTAGDFLTAAFKEFELTPTRLEAYAPGWRKTHPSEYPALWARIAERTAAPA